MNDRLTGSEGQHHDICFWNGDEARSPPMPPKASFLRGIKLESSVGRRQVGRKQCDHIATEDMSNPMCQSVAEPRPSVLGINPDEIDDCEAVGEKTVFVHLGHTIAIQKRTTYGREIRALGVQGFKPLGIVQPHTNQPRGGDDTSCLLFTELVEVFPDQVCGPVFG